jgi:putative zinc finger/helix-turn-helix YgiT family protein
MKKEPRVQSPKTDERGRFPIRCIECGQIEVRPAVIAYEVERNHDGKLYKLSIPDLRVNRCDHCGELYFDAAADEQIAAALRKRLHLLPPDAIRRNIASLGLTQKELAERMGVAAETMSRWLSGAMIQSRAMDNLMRLYFGLPELRAAIADRKSLPALGVSVGGNGSGRQQRSRILAGERKR